MAEPITEEDIISEWTIAVEALDISSIQELIELRPNLLWTPLKNSNHLESDFHHFIQRLDDFKLLGDSIRPVYALHHILFDYGLTEDEWETERIELIDFILKNTKGDELNTCVWGKEENTTMHLALLLNQPELIQQLLDNGASLSIPNKLGYLPTKDELELEEDVEDVRDDTKEGMDDGPTLIINRKEKEQTKEKAPLNTSDKFKRLREIAETAGNIKKTERQNSTRRYFRPGHLEERKRRVLSEEEEAELEKQRLMRQRDIAYLAQRSAVKNNPLFKKFEEQQQQQEEEQKPNPVRSAASIMRERRKLLNPADRVKRSSRVINSLKENSYVTSSIFRQQAPQTSNKIPAPKLKSTAPSPTSSETTLNTGDNKEEFEKKDHDAPLVNEPEEKSDSASTINEPKKQPDNIPQVSDPGEMQETLQEPSDLVEKNDSFSGKDKAVDSVTNDTQKQQPFSPPESLSKQDEEHSASLSAGKLKNQNLFEPKATSKPGVDIATSKVKQIINVHEHLNVEEDVESYATGKVFSLWKNEKSKDEAEENLDEHTRKQSKIVLEADVLEKKLSANDPKLSDNMTTLPLKSRSRPSSKHIVNNRDNPEDPESSDDEHSTSNANKLKFNGFASKDLEKNDVTVNRLNFNKSEKNNNESTHQVNKLKINNVHEDDMLKDDFHGSGHPLNGYQTSSSQKTNVSPNKLHLNPAESDEKRDTKSSQINKLNHGQLDIDDDNDKISQAGNRINMGGEDLLDSEKKPVHVNKLTMNGFLDAEKELPSINKLTVNEHGFVDAEKDSMNVDKLPMNGRGSVDAENDSGSTNDLTMDGPGFVDAGKDSITTTKIPIDEHGFADAEKDSPSVYKSTVNERGFVDAEKDSSSVNKLTINQRGFVDAGKDSTSVKKLPISKYDFLGAEKDSTSATKLAMNGPTLVDAGKVSTTIKQLPITDHSFVDAEKDPSTNTNERGFADVEKNSTSVNELSISEHRFVGAEKDSTSAEKLSMNGRGYVDVEKNSTSINKLPIAERGFVDAEKDQTANKLTMNERGFVDAEKNSTTINKLPIGERGFVDAEKDQRANKLTMDERGFVDAEKNTTTINKLPIGERGFVDAEKDQTANKLTMNERGFIDAEKNTTTTNKLPIGERGFVDAEKDQTANKLTMDERGFVDAEKNTTTTNKLPIGEGGFVGTEKDSPSANNLAMNEDSISVNNLLMSGHGFVGAEKDSTSANKLNINERGFVESASVNKPPIGEHGFVLAGTDSPSVKKLTINERGLMDTEKYSVGGSNVKTNDREHNNAAMASVSVGKLRIDEKIFTYKEFTNESQLSGNDQKPSNQKSGISGVNRFNFDQDNEAYSNIEKSQGSNKFSNFEKASHDDNSSSDKLPSLENEDYSKLGKGRLDDLEFNDHTRFDEPSESKKSNEQEMLTKEFSSVSLNEKGAPAPTSNNSKSQPVLYEDTIQISYDHTQQSDYRQNEPFNNASPLDSLTVPEEEYESDADSARTPTLSNTKPAEQVEWQSSYDKQLPSQSPSFEDDDDSDFLSAYGNNRYSTTSSVNEANILNSLTHQHKTQQDNNTTHWSHSSDSWHDPDESRRQSDNSSFSRNSSNYSFKNSNSTDITRLDSSSSDDEGYYKKREQQYDVVTENKATIQQELIQDDEGYYKKREQQYDVVTENKATIQQELIQNDEGYYKKREQQYDVVTENKATIQQELVQDDESYYKKREQQFDVVTENKSTIQQELIQDDEDEDYYSTALHQRDAKQGHYGSTGVEDGYHDRSTNQSLEYYNSQKNHESLPSTIGEDYNSQNARIHENEYYNSQAIKNQSNSDFNTENTRSQSNDTFNVETSKRPENEYFGIVETKATKSQENEHSNVQGTHSLEAQGNDYHSTHGSIKTRESEYDNKSYNDNKSYGDGEIVVFMDSQPNPPPQLLSPHFLNPNPASQDDSRSLVRVPSQTNTIFAVGADQELEDTPHDPKNPRIEDISHYLKDLPSLGNNKDMSGLSEFDAAAKQDKVMEKRAKTAKELQDQMPAVPPAMSDQTIPKAHEIGHSSQFDLHETLSSMEVSKHGKMYIGVSGAHHVLLPLPQEITYVRIVISDGEYEYTSRYEILTEQILMDYECVIDTKPGMIITVSLHVRPDYHVRPKTGWSRWFTSTRKQKEHLSGYVYPEDGAIGQTRFAVDHIIPWCHKKTYQAYFDCFNSWYARTNQERARREKFGDEEDFLKIVGKLNVEMLYLPVSSPSVQVPKSLRECDLTLKICQWHETCWQSGYLSTRRQGAKVWERHYYRLIGSQLIGYTTEENGRTKQAYNNFNIGDVIRLSAAADKVGAAFEDEEDLHTAFADSIHAGDSEKGFFRLNFNGYHVDYVSDTMKESEEWVKTLKSMIGHVQRFHSILDNMKNIFSKPV